LFHLAMSRFEAASASMPDSQLILKDWGDALRQQGLKKRGEQRWKTLAECAEKYQALESPVDMYNLARDLHAEVFKFSGAEHDQLFSLCNDCYKTANQKVGGQNHELLQHWSWLLFEEANTRSIKISLPDSINISLPDSVNISQPNSFNTSLLGQLLEGEIMILLLNFAFKQEREWLRRSDLKKIMS